MVSHQWLDTAPGRVWRRGVINLRSGLCSCPGCGEQLTDGHMVVFGAEFYRVFSPKERPDLKLHPANGFMLCRNHATDVELEFRSVDRGWTFGYVVDHVLEESPELLEGLLAEPHAEQEIAFSQLSQEQLDQRANRGSWKIIASDLPGMTGFNNARSDR